MFFKCYQTLNINDVYIEEFIPEPDILHQKLILIWWGWLPWSNEATLLYLKNHYFFGKIKSLFN